MERKKLNEDILQLIDDMAEGKKERSCKTCAFEHSCWDPGKPCHDYKNLETELALRCIGYLREIGWLQHHDSKLRNETVSSMHSLGYNPYQE